VIFDVSSDEESEESEDDDEDDARRRLRFLLRLRGATGLAGGIFVVFVVEWCRNSTGPKQGRLCDVQRTCQ
jgi:hypothetical protein